MASAADKPITKGQAWFCTTGLPSDVIIEVGEMTFHLHKFPLMSRSLKLHELITEQEKKPKNTEAKIQKSTDQDREDSTSAQGIEEAVDVDVDVDVEVEEEEEEEEGAYCQIALPDFPGGSEAFETAAKFCYGVKIDLSPSNVAPLRCAADFLQMTDEYSEDNLISKTDRYFHQNVIRNISHCIQTLYSCQKLLPLAENLGIVEGCIDGVVSKASSTDPSLFGWPVNDGRLVEKTTTRRTPTAAPGGGQNLWFEDLVILNLHFFRRLVLAMESQDLNHEIIENCLISYGMKHIPGVSRANRKASSSSSIFSENEQRELLETIIGNFPKEKSSHSSTATRFLFGLLRMANILNSSEGCQAMLEKKLGSQLEQATLDDLLIPSYSYLNETLYDVDCVERVLRHFLEAAGVEGEAENSGERSLALMLVGKLLDGYLSEIASDANLKPNRFFQLAISLPDEARVFHDGLYRAIDVYLKAHPWISEPEREKICSILNFQKLTPEACTHAAQNERLPLRTVVQVLFFEQLQLRHAITGTLMAADVEPSETGWNSGIIAGVEEDEAEPEVGEAEAEAARVSRWRAMVRENQVLRLDMDSMRTRVNELERECTTVKKAIRKIDRKDPQGGKGGWRSKLGCKFNTQVCDSEQTANVVESRKGRRHRRQ